MYLFRLLLRVEVFWWEYRLMKSLFFCRLRCVVWFMLFYWLMV